MDNLQNPNYAHLKFYESWDAGVMSPFVKVPAELAYTCQQEYLNRQPATTAKTHYIKFKKDDLLEWIKELESKVDYDCIRIYLGVYPDTRLPQAHTNDWKDKLTVFLVPYKGIRHASYKPQTGISSEEDVEAFNMGEIYP